jgi:hypothetical protein
MSNNPFVIHSNEKTDIPSFKRNKHFNVYISEEAYTNLLSLLAKFQLPASSLGVSFLLERIGLFALTVQPPELVTDAESGFTTEDCRESGYMDAMEGNPQRFLLLFGKMNDVFQEQYLRGYMEGNYIKNWDEE